MEIRFKKIPRRNFAFEFKFTYKIGVNSASPNVPTERELFVLYKFYPPGVLTGQNLLFSSAS
jgi:hypothetical protein